MPVIYTDEQGQGYDYDQLAAANASGRFGAGSRVGDILASYSAPAVTTPGGAGSEATPYALDQSGRQKVQKTDIQGADGGDGGGGGDVFSGGLPNVPAPGNDANQVAGWYSSFLGRAPEAGIVDTWLKSGLSLGQIQNAIANSSEAMTYAKSKGFGQPNPVPAQTGNGGGGAAPVNTTTPYKNSSQDLLLNAVLQRLKQLQTPVDTSMSDLFAKMGLAQVDKLNGPPFTDTQNAALLTQHMEPLTQARDTTKQQAAESLSRRGIGPSSGVFVDTMNKIDQAYQRGVAGVTNTLNIQGIDQQTKNNQLQLTILSSLADMSRVNQQIADQRSQELVTTAAIPFNTDLQTLSALSSAGGGDNASSLISSLLGLGGLNLKGNAIAADQSGQDAQAIGSVIGYIMSHHAEFGF